MLTLWPRTPADLRNGGGKEKKRNNERLDSSVFVLKSIKCLVNICQCRNVNYYKFKYDRLHAGEDKARASLCATEANTRGLERHRKKEWGVLTCQSDYDENSKHVRVLRQYTGRFHGHVLSAEQLNAFPYQLVEGSTPCTGHARGTCDGEKPVDLVRSSQAFFLFSHSGWVSFTNDVGKDEVPSGDEGPEFSYSHIGVKISRACLGNPGSKLSIAQTSQHWG